MFIRVLQSFKQTCVQGVDDFHERHMNRHQSPTTCRRESVAINGAINGLHTYSEDPGRYKAHTMNEYADGEPEKHVISKIAVYKSLGKRIRMGGIEGVRGRHHM